MIDAKTIGEILSLYARHGWTLRRVLLSGEMKQYLGSEAASIFEQVALYDSPIDALWFSRSSKEDCEAWELRHLTNTPFALVEVLENGLQTPEREAILKNTEMRLLKLKSEIPMSH